MKKTKIEEITELDLFKKVRRTWGVIKPVTKVIPSKKVYDRKKHKKIDSDP